MSEFLDLFYLLKEGKLPFATVDPSILPNIYTPVYRAFEYALSKPHHFPLVIADVESVALSRFHAKAEAKSFFTQLSIYTPNASTIESVQQSILLRKIVTAASQQLESGKYDLTQLGTYTAQVTSMGAASLVRVVSSPTAEDVHSVNYITGIDELDALLGGIHDELVVVSARPKNGKSNFFTNLICLSPRKTFLYVTVADYGYADFCQVLYDCEPGSIKRKNIYIADFTSFSATVLDVEAVIRSTSPHVVIVDRAEELAPLIKGKEQRWELKAIFKTLRQFAKKYMVPVFVDAQQSERGGEYTRKSGEVSPDNMAEDTTGRLATLDLFIGLQRQGRSVRLSCYGRRKTLPGTVNVRTNEMGVYRQ